MQRIGDGIWIVRNEFSVPAFGNIGGCATIIAYEPDSLMIVSPAKFTETELEEIRKLGDVRWLVSPNPIHHLYLPRAHRAFPDARLAGPERTALKQADLKFDLILTASAKMPWANGVDTIRFLARSPMDEEYVFFHHTTRTLVVCDLLFNLPPATTTWNKMWRKINRVGDGLAMSNVSRLLFDQNCVRLHAPEIDKLNPENLIMCHGEPILGQARDKISRALPQ